jgi:hypothetical protein
MLGAGGGVKKNAFRNRDLGPVERYLRGCCLCSVKEGHHTPFYTPAAVYLSSLRYCTILLTFAIL